MYSILYVDDEKALLEVAKLFLERSGRLSVDTVTSGAEALGRIAEKAYDAIISDYQMPGMDGIALLKAVRSAGNTIPFIIFTGKGREEIVIQALNEGADFYLQKGGDPVSQYAELEHKVQAAVQQRRAASALRNHERREADILNFLSDATFAIDIHGVVIAWNRAMETMTGIPASEILGKDNHEYALPFYHERRPILIDLVLADDPVAAACYPAITRDGKTLFSEIAIPHFNAGKGAVLWFTASPLYDTRGAIIGAIESIREITERKKAEVALQQSEQRYRDVVEEQSELISRFRPDGTHVFVNEAYCRYFGKTRNEILNHRFWPKMPAKDRKRLEAFLASLTPDHPVDIIEHRIILPDGSVHWQRWSDRAIFDENGSIFEYQSVGRDITERKLMEMQLRENEVQLRSILSRSPVPQFVIDKNHRIISWNRAIEEYSGIAAKEIVGTSDQWKAFYTERRPVLADLLVDENTDGLYKWYAGKIRKSRYVDGAYEAADFFPRMGVSGTWLSFTAALIRDADGSIIGAVETLEDITDRVRSETALKESAAKYRHILENMQDAYFQTGCDGLISMANPSAARLYGYDSADEMVGIPVTSLYEKPQQREDVLRKLKEAGGVTDFTGTGRRKDGTTFGVSLNVQFMQNDKGDILGTESTVRDITERRMLEHAITEANKKLALLSSITRHDIVNQVSLLRGFTRIAAMKTSDPGILDLLKKVDAAGSAIARQIAFTKVYQELGLHAPGWHQIRAIVEKISIEGISLSCTCDAEVLADPMLEKVFFNLFDNATRHGGKVTAVAVSCRQVENELVVTIADNGVGIPYDLKEKIFLRGFGKNTGLGLFLSREILAITGIAIAENGDPGTGARFEMAVPAGSFRFPGGH